MLHSRFRSNDKGELALATEINSKRQMTVAALVVVTIAVAVIALFSLSGCGGSGVTPKSSVNDYTWDELSKISAEIGRKTNENDAVNVAKKYNLVNSDGKLDGTQTKTIQLSNGMTATVQIAGFSHDDKTGGGKAGITFIFKDAIAKQSMNSSMYNSGGWEASQMRSWLATDGLSMLPLDLSSKIVAVDKNTNNAGGTKDISSVTMTSDKLWLFSLAELAGANRYYTVDDYNAVLNAEGSEYKLFRDCNVSQNGSNNILTKSYNGSSSNWFERSPDPNSRYGFMCVDSKGVPLGSTDASQLNGVVPGFCI